MSTFALIACAICSLGGLIISYSKNDDPFSPIKIFTFFNVVFYLDIYLNTYATSVIFIYLNQCLLITVLALAEPKSNIKDKINIEIKVKKAALIIWALTSIPMLTQLLVINELGGLAQTVGNIANRVKYFEGRGYLPVLNSFMIILNLLLFQVTIKAKKFSYTTCYAIHLTLLVLIGLLSGSRSFLAMTALAGCIIYNYQSKKVSIVKIAIIGISLIFLVALLGQLRNTVSIQNNQVTFQNTERENKLELSHLKYGLIPLEIITSSELKELQYGKTYLSLLTNFAPRSIFPEKLETGGIFFTRVYADDAWGGTSNLATGAITEGIINFGWLVGTLVGYASLFAVYALGIFLYKEFITSQAYKKQIFALIPYTYSILLSGRYSYSEFSYIFFSFALTVVFPILIFLTLYQLKTKFRSIRS